MYEINESIVEKIKLYKKNGLKSFIFINENIIL